MSDANLLKLRTILGTNSLAVIHKKLMDYLINSSLSLSPSVESFLSKLEPIQSQKFHLSQSLDRLKQPNSPDSSIQSILYSEPIELRESYQAGNDRLRKQRVFLPSEDEQSQIQRIEVLSLSGRSHNCLKRAGINTVDQLIAMSDDDLLAIHNVGPGTLAEIHEKLAAYLANPPEPALSQLEVYPPKPEQPQSQELFLPKPLQSETIEV